MQRTDFMKIFGKAYLLLALSVVGCGSFQSSSYYSDGIYGNADVVVIRKSNPQTTTNASAYTQYFDEKANQYTWEDDTEQLALTNIDSLGQNEVVNYKSNPNWGGGNKTTRIIIQDNRFNYGFPDPMWYSSFYNPWDFYWNRNYRFYNRWNWNRFAWGFNNPFYSPYTPFYLNGYYYNPHFYGGGFAYHRPYYARNHWNRRSFGDRQHDYRRSGKSFSSTYRGKARSQTVVRNRSRSISQNNGQKIASRSARNNNVPNLVQQGRRQSQAGRRRPISEQNNRRHINEVIRSYQNRGYNTKVIDNSRQQQSIQGQSSQGRRRVYSNNGNSTNTYKSTSSDTNGRRINSGRSSQSRSSSTQRSYQPSRNSYHAPSRSSYSSSRSSSRAAPSRSSSTGRRRQ